MTATLTRDSVLSMPAGREMDVLVAELVMGWLVKDGCYYSNGVVTPWMTPEHWGDYQGFRPSEDIAAAWEVVEKLWETHNYAVEGCNGSQFALFQSKDKSFSCHGLTAPLAICRAALLTTLGDV